MASLPPRPAPGGGGGGEWFGSPSLLYGDSFGGGGGGEAEKGDPPQLRLCPLYTATPRHWRGRTPEGAWVPVAPVQLALTLLPAGCDAASGEEDGVVMHVLATTPAPPAAGSAPGCVAVAAEVGRNNLGIAPVPHDLSRQHAGLTAVWQAGAVPAHDTVVLRVVALSKVAALFVTRGDGAPDAPPTAIGPDTPADLRAGDTLWLADRRYPYGLVFHAGTPPRPAAIPAPAAATVSVTPIVSPPPPPLPPAGVKRAGAEVAAGVEVVDADAAVSAAPAKRARHGGEESLEAWAAEEARLPPVGRLHLAAIQLAGLSREFAVPPAASVRWLLEALAAVFPPLSSAPDLAAVGAPALLHVLLLADEGVEAAGGGVESLAATVRQVADDAGLLDTSPAAAAAHVTRHDGGSVSQCMPLRLRRVAVPPFLMRGAASSSRDALRDTAALRVVLHVVRVAPDGLATGSEAATAMLLGAVHSLTPVPLRSATGIVATMPDGKLWQWGERAIAVSCNARFMPPKWDVTQRAVMDAADAAGRKALKKLVGVAGTAYPLLLLGSRAAATLGAAWGATDTDCALAAGGGWTTLVPIVPHRQEAGGASAAAAAAGTPSLVAAYSTLWQVVWERAAAAEAGAGTDVLSLPRAAPLPAPARSSAPDEGGDEGDASVDDGSVGDSGELQALAAAGAEGGGGGSRATGPKPFDLVMSGRRRRAAAAAPRVPAAAAAAAAGTMAAGTNPERPLSPVAGDMLTLPALPGVHHFRPHLPASIYGAETAAAAAAAAARAAEEVVVAPGSPPRATVIVETTSPAPAATAAAAAAASPAAAAHEVVDVAADEVDDDPPVAGGVAAAAVRMQTACGGGGAWHVPAPDAPPRWCTNNMGALSEYAHHPATFPGAVAMWSREWVVVHDRYPKALIHLLVVPRPALLALGGVAGAGALRPAHVAALRQLHRVALAVWVEATRSWAAAHPAFPMAHFPPPRIGFHAVPSLTPLHCHVVSADLHSECMKTKKHFLSFTAPAAFLPLADVISTLEDDLVGGDGLAIARHVAERALTGPLACHRCGAITRNIPTLKAHLATCFHVATVPPVSAPPAAGGAAGSGGGRGGVRDESDTE